MSPLKLLASVVCSKTKPSTRPTNIKYCSAAIVTCPWSDASPCPCVEIFEILLIAPALWSDTSCLTSNLFCHVNKWCNRNQKVLYSDRLYKRNHTSFVMHVLHLCHTGLKYACPNPYDACDLSHDNEICSLNADKEDNFRFLKGCYILKSFEHEKKISGGLYVMQQA